MVIPLFRNEAERKNRGLMAFTTNESTWDAFLADWPLERLRTMKLDEYTQAGAKNTFTYWMEARLDEYGSIWGGSSFKFGIYSRNETAPKQGDTSLAYDGHYGWYRRFGETPEAAFETVRRHVVAVAEAARAGQLEEIDDSELGPSYRWKIAFHYQNRAAAHPFPCVFLRKPLLFFNDQPSTNTSIPLSQLYRGASQRRQDDESLMLFSRRVWRTWATATPFRVTMTEGAVRHGYIPVNLGNAPFPESIRGGRTDQEAGEPAKFRFGSGLAFESDVRTVGSDNGRLRRRFPQYFRDEHVQPGDVLEIQPDEEGVFVITHHPGGKTPSGAATSPTLSPTLPVPATETHPMPVNKILFGPPGTGKTFHTINSTLEILDPEFLEEYENDRTALKERFDALVHNGLVRFVTFHQSFSYEDFVEGIRADADGAEGHLRYRVEDGVFKQLCEAARSRTTVELDSTVDVNGRRIWKLSLGESGSEGHIYDECVAKGIALLGFGADQDFSGVQSREDIVARLREAGELVGPNDYASTALNLFIRQMKTGDLVIVTQGNFKFRAIGEIAGDYRHIDRDGIDSYSQCRPVRWLRQYDPARPYAELMENQFSQMTIYELRPGKINMDRLTTLLRKEAATAAAPEARVLIIDEINRGNVSRIFGELITLIEPTKREGCNEALEVVLPYSKERFSVPSNVHLIGTMNTADRSLAGLDVALRRRFEFIEMPPRPDLLQGVSVEGVLLHPMLETMNRRIEVLLGRDYMLGHAYFLSLKDEPTIEALGGIFRKQVLPLLQEYFFEDWQKIALVLNDHRKPREHCFVVRPVVNISDLFGEGVDHPGDSRLWHVQEGAFYRIPSYLGIADKSEI